MENKLQIFSNSEFGQVRTIEENGKVLFCGKDIAQALGYKNPRESVRDFCPHGAKRSIGVQTGIKADGMPAMQIVEMAFIPEGDVYRLIIRSKLPAAEKFERWVFDEVIPSVVKTGSYGQPTIDVQLITQIAAAVASEMVTQFMPFLSTVGKDDCRQECEEDMDCSHYRRQAASVHELPTVQRQCE